MNQILKKGQAVTVDGTGTKWKVKEYIGGGGQGEVYKAESGGHEMALKWYFKHQATDAQRSAIETLVSKGEPDKRFLWPMELTSAEGIPGFGYVMPLRPSGHKSIVDLMKRRIEPTFMALATVGFELADGFRQLHARGLCYRDINFQNVFFEPNTGEVLICDNDNVGVDKGESCGVLGTPRFMAPEIVRGEAKPDSNTDLYSLAVLLFYLLMVHHPLEGEKESAIRSFDLPAMNLIYGEKPVFIFDPVDKSNRPLEGYHDNAIAFWPIYPECIRDLFTRSFTDGLHDPLNGRVREGEWRNAMVQLRNSIVYCPNCASENFYDTEKVIQTGGKLEPCWNCKREVPVPFRIKVGKDIIMLNHNTKLYPHHIDPDSEFDFSEPAAKVVKHPKLPGVWGLQNLTSENWTLTSSDGTVKDVPPRRSAELKNRAQIGFGKAGGTIRAGGAEV